MEFLRVWVCASTSGSDTPACVGAIWGEWHVRRCPLSPLSPGPVLRAGPMFVLTMHPQYWSCPFSTCITGAERKFCSVAPKRWPFIVLCCGKFCGGRIWSVFVQSVC